MRDGQDREREGQVRRERERWRKLREHRERNRKERKGESSPDPEKRETRKSGLKGARGCGFSPKGGREVKKPSLSRLQETLSSSD